MRATVQKLFNKVWNPVHSQLGYLASRVLSRRDRDWYINFRHSDRRKLGTLSRGIYLNGLFLAISTTSSWNKSTFDWVQKSNKGKTLKSYVQNTSHPRPGGGRRGKVNESHVPANRRENRGARPK